MIDEDFRIWLYEVAGTDNFTDSVAGTVDETAELTTLTRIGNTSIKTGLVILRELKI
jgi:hypothetical protein